MNTGKIVKSRHTGNYAVIPNDIFRRDDLSLKAKGLLGFLLTLPHDWVIYKTQLSDTLKVGKDTINSAFKELQGAGYILSVETREKGKISYQHIVYDLPFNGEKSKTIAGKPYTVKPSTVNTPLLNKEYKVNKN